MDNSPDRGVPSVGLHVSGFSPARLPHTLFCWIRSSEIDHDFGWLGRPTIPSSHRKLYRASSGWSARKRKHQPGSNREYVHGRCASARVGRGFSRVRRSHTEDCVRQHLSRLCCLAAKPL